MKLPITTDMVEANNVEAMAECFHPSAIWTEYHAAHPSRVIDAIEAALLYGAGRIYKKDFLQALYDLGEWDEERP